MAKTAQKHGRLRYRTNLQDRGSNVIVCEMFPRNVLVSLNYIYGYLNEALYISIITDYIHPIMLIVYFNGDNFFQQSDVSFLSPSTIFGFTNFAHVAPTIRISQSY